MSLTAAQICTIARNRASASIAYNAISGIYLNLALQEICLCGDYEAAKTPFNFTTTGATAPIGNLQVSLASGPFTLPPDYLRAVKGDIKLFWVPNFPQNLTPVDLAEFDSFVQQAGFQNIPVFWVTDVSIRRDVVTTGGTTVAASGTLSNIGNLNGIAVGMGVYGDAIAPGMVTLVTNVNSGTGTVTVSPAANVIATYADPARSSLTFAVCPIAYVWPPASGAYPVFVRYQRRMPDLYVPEASTQIPWFEFQDFLCNEVAGRLMMDTHDTRWKELVGGYLPDRLRKYLQLKDDSTNRAKRVTLDRRRFGSGWNTLPRSKILGY